MALHQAVVSHVQGPGSQNQQIGQYSPYHNLLYACVYTQIIAHSDELVLMKNCMWSHRVGRVYNTNFSSKPYIV